MTGRVLNCSPEELAEVLRLQARVSDRSIVADIECECTAYIERGVTWWDTRAMLSPDEHSSEVIDQATEALALARWRGLIEHHPQHAYLVRVTRRPA